MSLVHTKLFSSFRNVLDAADPRLDDYFLMGSPIPIITILVFYTVFVFKTGPALMKNRPPMKLDKALLIYNWVQIISNAALFLMSLRELSHLSIFCSPLELTNTPQATRTIFLQYGYTMLKVLDLIDTMFFVLRKKNRQITFLHVYHHLVMVVFSWVVMKFFVGGQVFYLGMANLFVHVIMYFYYFLTAWNPAYKENIWWKKYITQLQILQHFFIFVAFFLPFLNSSCSYPKPLLALLLLNTVMMIYLFTNFYVKTYIKKKVKPQ